MNRAIRIAALGLTTGVLALGTGCAKTGETAARDTLTANVGVYPPAPSSNPKPRAGLPCSFTARPATWPKPRKGRWP